ncbi:MAG: FliM/FliN family flagellar motor switch protein [Planctomycetales bacterium]|nr:FliM/FliN family flagellar motor switch protein [Planctomycetales bacterium]
MSTLTAEKLNDVVAACQAGAADAGEAFSRALDKQLTISVAGSGSGSADGLPDGLNTAGLVVLLDVGGTAAVVAVSESTGVLPDWYASPDVTGTNKLATLAQELGMTLLPDALMPDSFRAGHVDDLSAALRRGGLGRANALAAYVEFDVKPHDGEPAKAHLFFPLPDHAAVLVDKVKKHDKGQEDGGQTGDDAGVASAAASPVRAAQGSDNPSPQIQTPAIPSPPMMASLDDLPPYTKSLLQIKVPVEVTLASKRQPISHILSLNTGTIIQFEKSCDELLDLEIGQHRVGRGEAVKVGDKFGIRLTSIVLPEERFQPVRPPQVNGDAASGVTNSESSNVE